MSEVFYPLAQIAANPPTTEVPEPTASPDTSSAATEPAPSEPSIDAKMDRFTAEFEKLSKREAEMLAQKRELDAAQKELEELRAIRNKAKERPLDAVKDLGLDVGELLKRELNGGLADPHDEIAALREELASLRQELTQSSQQQTLARQADIWDLEFNKVSGSDEYEIVRKFHGDDFAKEAAAFAANVYEKTSQLLPPKTILDNMKKGLLDQHSKYLSVFGPPASAAAQPSPAVASRPERKVSGSTTLTQELGNTPTRYSAVDDIAEMQRLTAKYLRR